ncbi:flagellar biosynthetic protein FliQ [bacterium]|nr:flagellar biosynthetic protein FliQ [bacterium]
MLLMLAADHFDQDFMLSIINETLELMLKCSWPMLMAAILVGIIVAMFQSVTQVQEQTLSFVPKIVATFLAVAMYGPEICGDVQGFAAKILAQIGEMGANNSMFHH